MTIYLWMDDSVIVLLRRKQETFYTGFIERDEYSRHTVMGKCAQERWLYPLRNKVQIAPFPQKDSHINVQKQLYNAGIYPLYRLSGK